MQNIENLIYWKQSHETRQVLNLLLEEIQNSKDELLRGSLMVSPALEREYCRGIGYIQGLQFIDELIKDLGENQDE